MVFGWTGNYIFSHLWIGRPYHPQRTKKKYSHKPEKLTQHGPKKEYQAVVKRLKEDQTSLCNVIKEDKKRKRTLALEELLIAQKKNPAQAAYIEDEIKKYQEQNNKYTLIIRFPKEHIINEKIKALCLELFPPERFNVTFESSSQYKNSNRVEMHYKESEAHTA